MLYCLRYILVFALAIFISCKIFGSEYQAENGKTYKAVFETKNAGYSGEAYVNFDNEPGSALEIRVGLQSGGEQNLKIRFANGTSLARPMMLSLNDSVIQESLVFQPTGDWTNWDTLSVHVEIPAGIHTISFVSTGTEGGPNIDVLDLSGIQLNHYNLELEVSGKGAIHQFPDYGLLFEGQEIKLLAQPGFSYNFTEWGGDIHGTNDTLVFIIDSDKKIIAFFEEVWLEIPEPDFSMIGFATLPGNGLETTSGGSGGKITIVESLQQLRDWGASREDNNSPEIVIIKGFIEAPETEVITVKRGGNISILGDSNSDTGFAELKNISLNIRDYSNVIIRNLKIREVFYPDDGLTIDHCNHVWIDHCEFHSKFGSGIGVDTYDGLLDIKKGSNRVTVSWCYFHDHMKTLLMGHSDNNGEQDKDLQASFHHNWFSNTDGRNPSLRFGHIHFFNNYLENISDYGIAVRNGAHAKIENCHFQNVNIPVATDKFEGHGFACISGCLYTGTCTESDNQVSPPFECDFWNENLPYPYITEDVQTVSISVQKYAGVGKIEIPTTNRNKLFDNKFRILNCSFIKYSNQLRINVNCDIRQKISFSVFSIDGKIISSGTVLAEQGKQEIEVPVYSVNPGIYLLNLNSSKNSISRKIILN